MGSEALMVWADGHVDGPGWVMGSSSWRMLRAFAACMHAGWWLLCSVHF